MLFESIELPEVDDLLVEAASEAGDKILERTVPKSNGRSVKGYSDSKQQRKEKNGKERKQNKRKRSSYFSRCP